MLCKKTYQVHYSTDLLMLCRVAYAGGKEVVVVRLQQSPLKRLSSQQVGEEDS